MERLLAHFTLPQTPQLISSSGDRLNKTATSDEDTPAACPRHHNQFPTYQRAGKLARLFRIVTLSQPSRRLHAEPPLAKMHARMRHVSPLMFYHAVNEANHSRTPVSGLSALSAGKSADFCHSSWHPQGKVSARCPPSVTPFPRSSPCKPASRTATARPPAAIRLHSARPAGDCLRLP